MAMNSPGVNSNQGDYHISYHILESSAVWKLPLDYNCQPHCVDQTIRRLKLLLLILTIVIYFCKFDCAVLPFPLKSTKCELGRGHLSYLPILLVLGLTGVFSLIILIMDLAYFYYSHLSYSLQ